MVCFGKLKDSEEYGFGVFADRFETYVEVDDNEHMSLIEQANSQNKDIKPDKDGKPILVDRPPPSQKEVARMRINELEDYLRETDWYAIRFADSGEPIPPDVKKKRQDARNEISQLRENITE